MKGVKIKIVEVGEKVEGRRDTAERRDRHHNLGAVEHARKQRAKAVEIGKEGVIRRVLALG